MAGDWIKMRSNLWDDPRVGRLVDETGSKEATVIGALYWLWASADQHTETGAMPGLSLKQIDRKTGVKGFAQALCDVGWLEDHPDGVIITHFEEHNGASAKKRAQTAKRVANHKSGNAEVTQESENANAPSVSSALPREREEKEKEIKPTPLPANNDGASNSAHVVVADWSPPDDAIVQLELESGVPVEFSRTVLVEFCEYWTGRGAHPPATWTSRFLQRCVDQHQRRRTT